MTKEIQHIGPFLKWVGGKRQLTKKFSGFYPKGLLSGDIANYAEPFLGGGAVFFDLINQCSFTNIYLSDINADLISVYNQVKTDVDGLIAELSRLEFNYLKSNPEQRKIIYYEIRSDFNAKKRHKKPSAKEKTIRNAHFIFLNRTCYNGLYRLNSKGEFNVPAGRYVNPRILDEENLRNVSAILQEVDIKVGSFFDYYEYNTKEKTFFYFDPPYRPISKTASFTNYSKDVFNDAEQEKLCEVFKNLDKKGHAVMLSNSDPKNNNPNDNFFDELYKDYFIYRIPARRMVNSNPKKRGAINEIIVTNYPVKNK